MILKPKNEYFRGRRVWAVTDDGEVRAYTIDFWEPSVCSIRDMEHKKVFRFLPPKWVFLTREEAVQHAVWLLQNNIEASKRAVNFYNQQLNLQQKNLELRKKELLNGNKVESR